MKRIALLLALAPAPAMAAGFQDNAALDKAVAAFTGTAIGQTGGARTPVDPRLKLAQCPTLALAWRSAAQDAVVVQCTGPEWRIFVPVVMPAVQPLAAAAGVPARTLPAAAAAPVIRRGDPVTVSAGANGFSISREGIALGDAAPGARFLVKVDGAKGPVQATAISPGVATLPGWGGQ